MTSILRWVLVAQVAFFAVWGGYLLRSHQAARTVWLETQPVDPRDLLSGHYVALRYPLAETARRLCAEVPAQSPLYLRLQRSGEIVSTLEGPVEVSRATDCRPRPPAFGGEDWIVGQRTSGPAFGGIRFGIERFFVPEASPLRQVRSGDVIAKIAINDASRPRILDLTPVLRGTDEPSP